MSPRSSRATPATRILRVHTALRPPAGSLAPTKRRAEPSIRPLRRESSPLAISTPTDPPFGSARNGAPHPPPLPAARRARVAPGGRARWGPSEPAAPFPLHTPSTRNRPTTSSCCATPRQTKPSSRRPTTTSTTPMPHEGGGFRSPSRARWALRYSKTRLGASLRDRATLPSPLRGLDPAGGYPSRLRSQTRCALRLPTRQVRQWG